ncbi:ABC transporter permease [Rhodovarius crocodyli]|uniref:ABC transporter permease n=1 Tax=Rhodovarius crocodyli TaxID=1979269 RepID=A0A437MM21_9PROT|nr:ABC transporter permease [Rhodovarius crocodyli]RVT98672.1 ABC transporter permease [Rhodovarius crocodyli]
MSRLRMYDAATPKRRARSHEDLLEGFARWRLAWALARGDIMHRYRGSVLGPLWMTVSTAVMLMALGFLYAKLFRLPVVEYLPWLAASLIVWNMLAQITAEACTTLTSVEGILRQMPLPYSVQALRAVLRGALMAAHNLPLILLVFLVFGITPGWGTLAAVPGLALLAVDAFWASLLLGMVCARFRDIPPIVASVMQLAFFVTPVMWKPELVRGWAAWLPLNPFFAVMETIRGPLVGTGASATVWASALLYSLLLWAVAQAFFTRFRGRVAFWV